MNYNRPVVTLKTQILNRDDTKSVTLSEPSDYQTQRSRKDDFSIKPSSTFVQILFEKLKVQDTSTVAKKDEFEYVDASKPIETFEVFVLSIVDYKDWKRWQFKRFSLHENDIFDGPLDGRNWPYGYE